WVATFPPGGEKASGAGSGNRTHVYWVEASDSAIELCPRERRSAAGAGLATDRRSFWFRGSQSGSTREALGLSFDGRGLVGWLRRRKAAASGMDDCGSVSSACGPGLKANASDLSP